MATALTVQEIKGPFTAIGAGEADYTMAAADVTGNTFQCTGREIIVISNPAGGATYTVTVTSVADEKGRTGNITSYSMAAGDYVVFGVGLTNSQGWKSAAGLITLTANNAAVLIAVLRLPAGYPN
jgi:hypothetical protein